MFSNKEVATYYNHTLMHYKVGWQLNKSKGLHLGLWYQDTKNLHEALQNANEKVAGFIVNSGSAHILDAGCGVGGTAMYLSKNHHCSVEGITLSKAQVIQGKHYIHEAGLEGKVNLSVQDFVNTSFPERSFDLIYGIESICHAQEKADFYKEAFRLLKPGGKIVILDYYLSEKGKRPGNRKSLDWWLHRWAVSDLDDVPETVKKLKQEGFDTIQTENLTDHIRKSVRHMYRLAFWGLATIPLYFIFYPTKYQFSRRHPESGWALHRCYRKDLIRYYCFSAIKPVNNQ
ncbi:MAG: methyltransferase domain-containing protein [Bacteroidales bacterium]|nr:methyltransferase domain-containing protein [Bacteroidales bacterium]